MRILYLGYAVDIKEKKLSGLSIAGNKMQVNVLRELNKIEDVDLKCITVFPVTVFPKEKTLFFHKKTIQITDDISATRVGFCNLPLIKQIWQAIGVYNEAKKYIESNTIVLSFNMFPQVGLPSRWLKRCKKCRTYSLLADLPIDDNPNSKKLIRNVLRKAYEKITWSSILTLDGLVVLNRYAAKKFAPCIPYLVMEGGVNREEVLPLQIKRASSKKTIVYCGALTEYSGVLTLIDAMEFIDDENVILEIYGGGYIENAIREKTSKLKNVNFCGKVTNEEMIKIQREAYLLVNPRPTQDAIAEVTFPSKLFEYMTSGTPVITTRLNGLSDEMLSHMYVFDCETSYGFADTLKDVLKKDPQELSDKAVGAYNYIVEEKNWEKQCERMLDFLQKDSVE